MSIKEKVDKEIENLIDTKVILWLDKPDFEAFIDEVKPSLRSEYLKPIESTQTHYVHYKNKFIGMK